MARRYGSLFDLKMIGLQIQGKGKGKAQLERDRRRLIYLHFTQFRNTYRYNQSLNLHTSIRKQLL